MGSIFKSLSFYCQIAPGPFQFEQLACNSTSINSTSVVNSIDQTPTRKVWHQFWDTKITIPTSYLARLNYVHQNPVKHGLVSIASQYDWCSAKKFEVYAKRSFVKSVYSFDFTKVNIYDTF